MTDETGVTVYRSDPPLDAIFEVRRRVFVDGQGVPESEEIDGRDGDAVQFLARADGRPVGTARLREPEQGVGKAERVAVLDAHRGEGWGRELMAALERVASEDDLDRIVLHGQTRVQEFYEALGYETISDVYLEVGIPHVTMEKEL